MEAARKNRTNVMVKGKERGQNSDGRREVPGGNTTIATEKQIKEDPSELMPTPGEAPPKPGGHGDQQIGTQTSRWKGRGT